MNERIVNKPIRNLGQQIEMVPQKKKEEFEKELIELKDTLDESKGKERRISVQSKQRNLVANLISHIDSMQRDLVANLVSHFDSTQRNLVAKLVSIYNQALEEDKHNQICEAKQESVKQKETIIMACQVTFLDFFKPFLVFFKPFLVFFIPLWVLYGRVDEGDFNPSHPDFTDPLLMEHEARMPPPPPDTTMTVVIEDGGAPPESKLPLASVDELPSNQSTLSPQTVIYMPDSPIAVKPVAVAPIVAPIAVVAPTMVIPTAHHRFS